ncbi:NAD-dependent dehydratase [Pusillimonas sp. T2]|uniref:NAD-dependent epimerase/dehydratase family protein n=1 Tax=Pusillimonas sp. T2 TaxID=1548123 RepID=UPI000B9466D9|nr:NAD(P)-dependent oxidoreductase [Pusillimonas sp. T2]OXR47989.1 NAD-dependent dehydratase [Pusillimonas sp. T2]
MSVRCATIIGGNGFIGRALKAHLMQQGWAVWEPSRAQRWPETSRSLGHVFYCAGLTSDYLKRPADTVLAHVSLLSAVLQSTSYTSLVYLSSTRVYDSLPEGGVAFEDTPLIVNPGCARQLYDLTKLTGEAVCHALGGGRARVARLSCVYAGPSDSEGFLPRLLGKILGAEMDASVIIDSSPSYTRDYVHLTDVLRALVDIAVRGKHATYNVASGHNVSNAQLAAQVKSITGRAIEFLNSQYAPEPAVVSIERLVADFGWYPVQVDQQMKATLGVAT